MIRDIMLGIAGLLLYNISIVIIRFTKRARKKFRPKRD